MEDNTTRGERRKHRRTFSKEFKVDAVRLVSEGNRSVVDVAREIGIDPNTLYHWKRESEKDGEEAFPGKGHLTAQEEEIRRLRKRLAEAEEDREILKKALGFFSRRGK